MGKLNDLAKEVILNSELIKPYRVSFKDIIFVKRFDLDNICDENHSCCDFKGIIVDTKSKELYIEEDALYTEFESNESTSLLELIQFRILLGLGFLNVKRGSVNNIDENQYWVISFHHAVSDILQNDVNNVYGYNLTNEFYYFFKMVTGKNYFNFKTDENNKLIRTHYKIDYQQMA